MAARIVAGIIALGALAPLGGAGAIPLAAATPGVETPAEAALRAARDRMDQTSARLMAARSAAETVGGPERDELLRLERRLQAQKADLVETENALAEEHARQQADADAAAAAATTAATALPIPYAAPAAATATTPTALPAVTPYLPALTTDDAALATALDGYLATKGSPMTGLGAVFVNEARATGFDPRFIVAISGAETSFGTYGPSQLIQNPFGMGPGISYASWADAIRAACQNLAGAYYVGEGRYTIAAIQQRWAPHGATNDPTGLNSNWTRNVSTYYAELGGDPSGAVYTGVVAQAYIAPPAA
jgi:hypothetical protein